MTFPKRIILSRKGFDSSAGGCPSPILPDGTMLSIPIPESRAHPVKTRFEDLGLQAIVALPQSLVMSPRRSIRLTTDQVHLDPDIRPTLRPQHGRKACSPRLLLYGQDGGFQTHLAGQGVTEGDLFLFFGWYRSAQWHGRDLHFVRGAPNKHVLWGWLQVGKKHCISRNGAIPAALQAAKHHPHLDCLDRETNCLYEASPSLTFSPNHAGAGIFNPYSADLCLTAPDERRRSFWKLPRFFQRTRASHLDWNRWTFEGDSIFGRSPGRGQEFVFETAPVLHDVEAWLKMIFQHASKQEEDETGLSMDELYARLDAAGAADFVLERDDGPLVDRDWMEGL